MFDSIINSNEFLSDHWLAEAFPSKLTALNKKWTEREGRAETTPTKGLAGIGAIYARACLDIPQPGDESYVQATTAAHSILLTAMGYVPEPQILHTANGPVDVDVPLLARITINGADMLHVLQARPVSSDDELVSSDALLVAPIVEHPEKDRPTHIRTVDKAVSLLFLLDDAPRFVLVVATNWVLLTDAERWAEGRYLAFDVETALSRHNTKAAGELAWHAGLWSADVLLPPDTGEAPEMARFTDDSIKHAVGVSEDLREGLRVSVELIANEVLSKRRAAELPIEGVDDLPAEITAQTLRFLYRILFLLFAEARPELGILPVGAPEYAEGYGIDRLRELVLVPLSPQAAQGHHFHDSLDVLFGLVNNGHNPEAEQRSAVADAPVTTAAASTAASTADVPPDAHSAGLPDPTAETGTGDGLVFEALKADLFSDHAVADIDSIRLSNAVLQQVLELLLLSKRSTAKGKQRGFVSYAQLGINQLGAVYEGLMAYTGFIATEDLVELAKDGNPKKGTWMVPPERLGDFDPKHIVTREDPATGAQVQVTHAKGSFVYRLAGRDRQRSASYYTPEILTRTVVKHALAELLTDATPADDLLHLTVCEPALGSGAFLNEAINQMAAQYLHRRQRELGQTIEPARYQEELQRVKAHLALHQVYGVDLNATAVELAEVSLWLNVMHPGLTAPWFGLHLRRGNSLIGARRAVYNLNRPTLQKDWHSTAPIDRPLSDGPLKPNEVHHFLLPAAGWGAAGDAKEAKELAKPQAESLRAWSKRTRRKLTKTEVDRAVNLAKRVERLWELAQRRLEISEHEIARTIEVWGRAESPEGGGVARHEVESALLDPDSPYLRLRLAMSAWCALFFWPVTDGTPNPPDLAEWLDTFEGLLGIHAKEATPGQFGLHDLPEDFRALGQLDDNEMRFSGMTRISNLLSAKPWLRTARDIAQREGFFHWELDFAQVFARGGFDMVVGNPPWVRPTWEEGSVLAEADAMLGIVELKSMDKDAFAIRRAEILLVEENRTAYLQALTDNAALSYIVSDRVMYPQLGGTSNLYRNFILIADRLRGPKGFASLLHPDDHLMHDKSGDLREWIYPRLRRRWAFINEMKLFEDPSDTEEFGISVYGAPHEVSFMQIYGLYHPSTLEGSLGHDGSGPVPAFQLPAGGWDLRSHRSRIVQVDEGVLREWSSILESPGTPYLKTRALNPVVDQVAETLSILSQQKHRMEGRYDWTDCWHEGKFKLPDGYARWGTSQPPDLTHLVLQPSHFSILNPLAKQPPVDAKANSAFQAIDLSMAPSNMIPRTNYTLREDALSGGRAGKYFTDIRKWDGRPVIDFWRLAWRRRLGQNMARTLHAALIPPGPAHVDTVHTLFMTDSNRLTALIAGFWSALPFDFLIKTLNSGDLRSGLVDRLAVPAYPSTEAPILTRVLRLNAVTQPYRELLREIWEPAMQSEGWTRPFRHLSPIAIGNDSWDANFPLRADEARRAALVELDALVAISLGMSSDNLAAIYNSTFPVLRKYEYGTYFDASGQLIAKHHQQAGYQQHKDDFKNLQAYLVGEDAGDLLDRYTPPFHQPDREAEMHAAYAEFSERLGE